MRQLIDNLAKQLDIYEKLLKKTLTGETAFKNGDSEAFVSVLSERLALMNEANTLEETLKPLREEWIKSKDSYSDIFNNKVVSIVQRIKKIMDEIFAIENKIMSSNKQVKQDVTAIPRAKAINKYKKI